MFQLVKPFLIAVGVITFLLFAIGMIKFEKPAYACFNGKHIRFDKKVMMVNVGSLQIYGYPLVSDCPDDERYDPALIYECGFRKYCQKQSDGQAAE
jgi:hypothetical protein